MNVGLEIRDKNGDILFTSDMGTSRILGSFMANEPEGTIQIDIPPRYKLFCYQSTSNTNEQDSAPSLLLSTPTRNTIKWVYDTDFSGSTTIVPQEITYGIY